MKLYISHGAPRSSSRDDTDWFIVEPRCNPDAQVASLVAAGRTVYELDDVQPFQAQKKHR